MEKLEMQGSSTSSEVECAGATAMRTTTTSIVTASSRRGVMFLDDDVEGAHDVTADEREMAAILRSRGESIHSSVSSAYVIKYDTS